MKTQFAVHVLVALLALPQTTAIIARTITPSYPAAPQQSLQLQVVYTCNGERLVVLRCRSEADDAYCSVQYPDRKGAGGLVPELAEKRGALIKKLQSCGALEGGAPRRPESAQPHTSDPSAATSAPARPATSTTTKTTAGGNSTLSLRGSYVYEKKDSSGKILSSEPGTFALTTFHLVDDDVENVLQEAGIPPITYRTTPLIGASTQIRYSLLETMETARKYFEGTDTMRAAMDNYRPGLLFGAGDKAQYALSGSDTYPIYANAAKVRYELAMKAISSHTLAQMATDAGGKGVFPSVPAGAYYLWADSRTRKGELYSHGI